MKKISYICIAGWSGLKSGLPAKPKFITQFQHYLQLYHIMKNIICYSIALVGLWGLSGCNGTM
ncbi:MAG: hypothetical protein K2H58_00125, partial [Paramuribaculum sp.]|nr:hypothetical protein [Paramuribaculum sp.]